MTDDDRAGRCYECGRSLGLVAPEAIETARESVGFGAANDRTRAFCSTRCRCLWQNVDPVIDATLQARLAVFAECGRFDRSHTDAIAWGR